MDHFAPRGGLPLVKICGLRREQDLRAASEAGADLVGMVFAPSRRRVAPEEARTLLASVPEHPPVVGVFKDASPAEVRGAIETAGLDLVQLCGDESWAASQPLPVPYLKVIPVRAGSQVTDILHIMNGYPNAAAYLLDTWSPQGGGSGMAMDWDLARKVIELADRPVLLAGGLRPDTVAEALAATGARGVDVSSGVELDGWKDAALIASFVRSAHQMPFAAALNVEA